MRSFRRTDIVLCSLAAGIFGVLGHSCAASRKPVSVGIAKRSPTPILLEDELGVAGGPVDHTEFVFEPEQAEEHDPRLLLDGVPDSPPWVKATLAPYLESRRARLQSTAVDASWIVAITRLEQTAQAYRVSKPMGALKQVTRGGEPIVQVSPVPKVRDAWVYRTDTSGTEDYQIMRIEPGAEPALLTDGIHRHGPFSWSPGGTALAFTSNARNGRDMDVYLSDGMAGTAPELLLEASGSWSVSGWSADEQSLLLRNYEAFNHSSLHLFDRTSKSLRGLVSEDEPPAAYLRGRMTPDGSLYATSNRGGEFSHLYHVDIERREWTDLTPDLTWDVEEIAVDAKTNRIAYAVNEDGLSRIYLLDLVTGASRALTSVPAAVVSDMRFANSGATLAFTLDSAADTGDVHVLDLEKSDLKRWTMSRSPGLDYDRFVTPQLVRVPSFDGVEVPSWVYAPRTSGPHPVLLWIHGGPEEQHQPSFSPLIQYFVAELGVAVIAPNVRGSDGYGRTYVSLDNGYRREDAIADVGAVLDWIGESEGFDSTRVGIYGGSYGGYVVLASLIHHGKRLAAGADLVGISNFVTFLENTGEYRRDQRRAEYGDERDPAMREFLETISPTRRAEEIRSPLFVAHGANDPRVPLAEAQQIVDAVRAGGQEAWMMVAMDEGHGFHKRDNRDRFYAALVTFFAEHLGLVP